VELAARGYKRVGGSIVMPNQQLEALVSGARRGGKAMGQQIPSDFAEFMKRREGAARAFINGDFGPSRPILTEDAPATFFDPWGGCHQGPGNVRDCYERNASLFGSGSCTFETLQLGADERVGYWVFVQQGTVRLQGATEPIAASLRVTEIFRRERGEWKLVHRHADAPDNIVRSVVR
jgi:ketosteroid isomerase-like protein